MGAFNHGGLMCDWRGATQLGLHGAHVKTMPQRECTHAESEAPRVVLAYRALRRR